MVLQPLLLSKREAFGWHAVPGQYPCYRIEYLQKAHSFLIGSVSPDVAVFFFSQCPNIERDKFCVSAILCAKAEDIADPVKNRGRSDFRRLVLEQFRMALDDILNLCKSLLIKDTGSVFITCHAPNFAGFLDLNAGNWQEPGIFEFVAK